MYTITITNLTGKLLYSAGFTGMHHWGAIVEWAAEHFNCRQDDINLLETDEGDMIAVGYRAVGRIS